MSNEVQHLQTNAAFAPLEEAELAQLLSEAIRRPFAAGEILLEEGQPGDSMLIILSGKVEVRRGALPIATRSDVHLLGEMALVDPAPRSATAVALSGGELLELSRDALWSLLQRREPAAAKLLQSLTVLMCERLNEINMLVQEEVVGPPKQGNVFHRLWSRLLGKGEE